MNKLLDKFGEILIRDVRDSTYSEIKRIFTGEVKSKSAKRLYEEIKKENQSCSSLAEKVALDAIDSALHHFLWMIEQHEGLDLVIYDSKNNKAVSLKETSDGLCGELHTEDGWIERFSKYPPSI